MVNRLFGSIVLCIFVCFPAFTAEITLQELLKQGNKGNLTAQVYLGMFYANSKNADDSFKAEKWYKKAAEQGSVDAQAALGSLYYQGFKKIPQNTEKAIFWLTKAAKRNHIKAQFALASLYNKKDSKYYNLELADKWMTPPAESGMAEALFAKAMMSFTANNYKAAEKWFIKAAAQRLPNALPFLGLMYIYPEMRGPDYVKSYVWLKLATNIKQNYTGKELAVKNLPKVERKLSPKELKEANLFLRVGPVIVSFLADAF
jgi:hypothetical protein